jgi:AcrR family transcriptional regulator
MTKNESKDQRINDILEAAVDIFVEKGYENTSMNEIAAHAGISKGGLYHHFTSKDMIILSASEKLSKPYEKIMSNAIQKDTSAESLRYFIHEYLKYWIEHKREYVFFLLLMSKTITHTGFTNEYESFTESNISLFEQFYIRGIKNGEFADHNSRASGVTLMSALDGIISYMLLDSKLHLEEIVSNFEVIFIHPFLKKVVS